MGAVQHFDLIVIGSGSGNTLPGPATEGMSVALVEDGVFGGTCLNVGCIPSKMLIYPARIADSARHEGPRLGVDSRVGGVRLRDIRDRIFGRIDALSMAGEQQRRDGEDGTTLIHGTARFVGPRTLHVGDGSGGATISADQIVIATGSTPTIPDLDGLAESRYHTSDTVMRLPELPKHLVVLGSGYVAAEMAHAFAGYGSEVTIIARSDLLLRGHDDAISTAYTRAAQKQYDVVLNARTTRVRRVGETVTLDVRTPEGDRQVRGHTLLVATGRAPATDRLECSAGGVERDTGGRVVVDAFQRTTAAGVWALGDACSRWMLKHVANEQARVVAHNLGHPDDLARAEDRVVPHAVFASPEIASVGATESDLRESGTDYAVGTHRYADTAYGWAMEDEIGFCKVLADRGTGVLLGAHIVGAHASLLIQPLVQAMSLGRPAQQTAREQYWIHPALSEVVENALLAVG